MSYLPCAEQAEARSTEELVSLALNCPDVNDDQRWGIISVLHRRGTREVFEAARDLCSGESPREKCLGADILAQLGVPDRPFREESVSLLAGLLWKETDTSVLESAAYALGHLRHPDGIAPLLFHKNHPDPLVRLAVAYGLSALEDQRAVAGLIELSADPDPDVRDWATFGLGTQIDLDTPAIRDALAARLTDPDEDARGEALVGLAKRNDERVIEPLLRELVVGLEGAEDMEKAFEAAALMSDPRLYSVLLDWAKKVGPSPDSPSLGEALERCRPTE